jgi:hypothetical protein
VFEKADLIHRHTRADALRDGVLIDVSAADRDAGFTYPVALTAAAPISRRSKANVSAKTTPPKRGNGVRQPARAPLFRGCPGGTDACLSSC